MKFYVILSAIVLALNAPGSWSAVVPSDQNANSIQPPANKPPSTSSPESIQSLLAKLSLAEKVTFTANKATSKVYKNIPKNESGNSAMSSMSFLDPMKDLFVLSTQQDQDIVNSSWQIPFTKDEGAAELTQLFKDVTKNHNNKYVKIVRIPEDEEMTNELLNSTLYGSRLQSLESSDFSDKEELIDELNNKISLITKKNIEDFVTPADLNNAAIYLGNAGYFKVEFEQKSDQSIKRESFTNIQNVNESYVPYIELTGNFPTSYFENHKTQCLEMPTKNEALRIFFLLSEDKKSHEAIGKSIDQLNLIDISSSNYTVTVNLPLFNQTNEQNYEEAMKQADIGAIQVNLTNIIKGKVLETPKIIQKTVANLTSNGFEMYYATKVVAQKQENQSEISSKANVGNQSNYSEIESSVANAPQKLNFNGPFHIVLVTREGLIISVTSVGSVSNDL